MSQPLILLFGMPRSGTTWIGKIFDSHPDTLYRHEPDSRSTLNALPLFASGRDAEQYRAVLEGYVRHLPAVRDESVSASRPLFPKRYYARRPGGVRELAVLGVKVASRVPSPLPAPRFVDLRGRTDFSLVWKSIESLGRLGVLARVFPHARCLIILRHPGGYAASVLRGQAKRKFEAATPACEDWGIYEMLLELPAAKARALELAAVKAMTPVERLALRWALYYEHALAETEGLENVLTVRYEDFCARPQEEARKSFGHCRLSWAAETERFIARSTARDDAQYYSVFKDPGAAASKWRTELGTAEADSITEVVAGYRAARYYPATAGASSEDPDPGLREPT